MSFLPKRESGQALLLVLLSMAVVLTVVLSILSRSVTDVAVTTREEEALRAFSAAEAGVEQALIIGSDIGTTTIGDASFSADVSSYAVGQQEFANPISVASGESVLFWFVAHDPNTGDMVCNVSYPCFTGSQIKVCWGNPGTASDQATTPAIEVSTFYEATPGNPTTMRIARDTSDPNAGRRTGNNFATPDAGTCTVVGEDFQFGKTVN